MIILEEGIRFGKSILRQGQVFDVTETLCLVPTARLVPHPRHTLRVEVDGFHDAHEGIAAGVGH